MIIIKQISPELLKHIESYIEEYNRQKKIAQNIIWKQQIGKN